ncbi:hypothetical protein ACROYT_G043140 [Oculina patagonica]
MNILYATSLFTVYEICKAPNTDLLVAVRRRKSDAVWKQLLLFHNFSFKNKLITIDTVEESLILQLGAVIRSELDRDPQKVKGKITLYGEGVSLLKEQEFLDQICPKPNSDERKYIRIKTFNDKYVWAEPKYWGEGSYLRTRCCGAKDATGRTDVTEPGRRTTFLIHCKRANNQNVFSFEILAKDKNTPSGYFFYADPNHYKIGLYARKLSSKAKHAHKFNFIIDRWRGPVVAIRTQGKAGTTKEQEKSMWLKFSDTGHGYVSGHNNLYRDPPGFPNFSDMFSLEAVPSGCVYGAAERDNVWAAPPGTSHEECESKPDRCYWTDGWKSGKMQPGKCYYNKDSKCHWHRTSSGIPLSRVCMLSNKLLLEPPAAECEAANCCFDYKRKQCYRQL